MLPLYSDREISCLASYKWVTSPNATLVDPGLLKTRNTMLEYNARIQNCPANYSPRVLQIQFEEASLLRPLP
jgi:hypothetical protein